VSPAPARTSRDAIVAAARAILEEDGIEAVTMVTVAGRVGVRPPSLYKHVRDRQALVTALVQGAADELRDGLVAASAAVDDASGPDPDAERVAAIADAYRDFARQRPRSASLLFADLGPATGEVLAVSARAAEPVIAAAAALAGPDRALPAARVLTAFVHGFTSMELAGAFRLGGDIDEAFRLGVATLVRGLRDEPPTHDPAAS
jgi:AcrR family transcriptional regulator